jgi:hypothetical protein
MVAPESPRGDADLERFISGGYVIGRRVPRPACMSQGLLPDQIISMSSCITEFTPDTWALQWCGLSAQEQIAEAGKFGIPPGSVGSLVEKMTRAFDTGEFLWPCVFPTIRLAREFFEAFIPEPQQAIILGAGIHEELAPGFLDAAEAPPDHNPPGVYRCVARGAPVETEGRRLGWEVLGYDWGGSFHSWLCNGLETEVFERLGIRPGSHGLLQSWPEAQAAAEFCASDEAKGEPAVWHPWLIVQYRPTRNAG